MTFLQEDIFMSEIRFFDANAVIGTACFPGASLAATPEELSRDMAEIRLEKALAYHTESMNDPAPIVKVNSYGDSAVRLIVRVWTKREDYWDVYFDITESVKSEFDKNGITIPYNQIDVHFFPPAEK